MQALKSGRGNNGYSQMFRRGACMRVGRDVGNMGRISPKPKNKSTPWKMDGVFVRGGGKGKGKSKEKKGTNV